MKTMFRTLLVLILPALSWSTPAANPSAGDTPAVGSQSAYVGDACMSCHEDVYKKQFETTPHFQTTLKNGHGCESCHGPGAEHVAGGGDKTKIIRFSELSRAAINSRCLECHGDQGARRHAAGSVHASNEVSCLDCHSPHYAKEEQHLLVKKQTELCFGCHAATRADFARPYHHRVNEGLIACADCHNVHGTSTVRQVRDSAGGDAVCFKCHAEKQGPFVYEHMPVKTDGCTSCHTVHGSTNPRLLRVSQVNLLCLQCHSYPGLGPSGPAHNQSQKYQACTMCHAAIHGSNANVAFMR
jgi:DmsE family decaheme c-type cytochrome